VSAGAGQPALAIAAVARARWKTGAGLRDATRRCRVTWP